MVIASEMLNATPPPKKHDPKVDSSRTAGAKKPVPNVGGKRKSPAKKSDDPSTSEKSAGKKAKVTPDAQAQPQAQAPPQALPQAPSQAPPQTEVQAQTQAQVEKANSNVFIFGNVFHVNYLFSLLSNSGLLLLLLPFLHMLLVCMMVKMLFLLMVTFL